MSTTAVAGTAPSAFAERGEAVEKDVAAEQRPGAVVDGDDFGVGGHYGQAGAHRVAAFTTALGDEHGLALLADVGQAGEAHDVRRVQHHDDAGHLVDRREAPHRVADDGLARQQQELLGLALGQSHAPAFAGGRDDHPGLCAC